LDIPLGFPVAELGGGTRESKGIAAGPLFYFRWSVH